MKAPWYSTVTAWLLALSLFGCSNERLEDVSGDATYANYLASEFVVIGALDAYGIRRHSGAPVDYVTLIPPPGIEGYEVAFRVPVKTGSRVKILKVYRTNRVFDANITYEVLLSGTSLPVRTSIRIDLFRGNEGRGTLDLNPLIYRKL